LHEYSGEWEDFRDRIVGSYLRKERAEEEKTRAEAEEKELVKKSKRCNNCPVFDAYPFASLDSLLDKYCDYCSEMKLEETDYGLNCDNCYHHWYESTFYIEEVDVEE
jgi:hypothetical protein